MHLESPDLYERVAGAWRMFCNGDINKMEYEIIENMAFRENTERRNSKGISP